MLQTLKKRLQNEQGLTLIELLAVIVILGIISAIAIPSIGGLIDNSKKDAHVANAQQMINAAKMVVTTDNALLAETKLLIPLKYLEDQGYLEPMKDPDSGNYVKNADKITKDPTSQPADSFVLAKKEGTAKNFSYEVKLINGKRGVQTESKVAVKEDKVKRENVRDN